MKDRNPLSSERRRNAADRRLVDRGGRRSGERSMLDSAERASSPAALAAPLNHVPFVLVVDDYDDGREMTTEYLRMSGFRVADASSGAEALEKAITLQPDLILLDIVLRDMDGWQVISRLKENEQMKRIGVAVHTASVTPAVRERARAAGADLFLPRPCELQSVARQLASILTARYETHV